jgi:hypothetical protein
VVTLEDSTGQGSSETDAAQPAGSATAASVSASTNDTEGTDEGRKNSASVVVEEVNPDDVLDVSTFKEFHVGSVDNFLSSVFPIF